jgi:hypothetical protein
MLKIITYRLSFVKILGDKEGKVNSEVRYDVGGQEAAYWAPICADRLRLD